ncbi:MAG: extracellular solute-binding protein [Trueperaceae bacterium]|nr:MAG: extracellular solute-binding protein [Trueperaceae bacterium]
MKKYLIVLVTLFAGLGLAFGQGLTVWTTWRDLTLEWFQNETAAFTEAFGVPVEIVRVDFAQAQPDWLLSAPAGEAGDLLVGVPHDRIGELAAAGVAANMTSFATADFLKDLSEQARVGFTIGGKLFALPMYVEGPALIVNADLVPEAPATYEELLAVAQELTSGDSFGFMYDSANFYFSYNWLHTFGGFVFGRDAQGDLDPAELGLANEGAIRGGEAIKALRHELGLIPAGTDYPTVTGLFSEGALAMTYNGPWEIENFRNAGITNLKVMPIPPLADGTPFSGFMGVQGVVLNPFSKNRADAANFTKWLARPAAQVSLAQLSGRIPASGSALAQVNDDPVIAGFGQALLNAEPMPNIPEMGSVWGPMGTALTVILESADSDVAGSLTQAASEILGN